MADGTLDALLFVAFPYVAVAFMVVGSIVRYRRRRFGYTSLSSQILERRVLVWGSVPFHFGILLLIVGHVAPLVAPGVWRVLVRAPAARDAIEIVGLSTGLLTLAGLLVAAGRRLFSERLRAVTSWMDALVLALLVAQVGLGLSVALADRWGSVWSASTTTPYLIGLLTLRPDAALVSGLPVLVRIHLTGAWLIALLLPFTRLVHLFSLPLRYLFRPWQKVIWSNERRRPARSGG